MSSSHKKQEQETVLEEDFENYEPSQEEIYEYARYLGLDIEKESELLWIAKQGLKAPLPPGWKACQTSQGEIYYFNFDRGESRWDHPCDEQFRELARQEKLAHSKKGLPECISEKEDEEESARKRDELEKGQFATNNLILFSSRDDVSSPEKDDEEEEQKNLQERIQNAAILLEARKREIEAEYEEAKRKKVEEFERELLLLNEESSATAEETGTTPLLLLEVRKELEEELKAENELLEHNSEQELALLKLECEEEYQAEYCSLQEQVEELEREQDLEEQRREEELKELQTEHAKKLQQLENDYNTESVQLAQSIQQNTREILENEEKRLRDELYQLEKTIAGGGEQEEEGKVLEEGEEGVLKARLQAQYEKEIEEFREELEREMQQRKTEITERVSEEEREAYCKLKGRRQVEAEEDLEAFAEEQQRNSEQLYQREKEELESRFEREFEDFKESYMQTIDEEIQKIDEEKKEKLKRTTTFEEFEDFTKHEETKLRLEEQQGLLKQLSEDYQQRRDEHRQAIELTEQLEKQVQEDEAELEGLERKLELLQEQSQAATEKREEAKELRAMLAESDREIESLKAEIRDYSQLFNSGDVEEGATKVEEEEEEEEGENSDQKHNIHSGQQYLYAQCLESADEKEEIDRIERELDDLRNLIQRNSVSEDDKENSFTTHNQVRLFAPTTINSGIHAEYGSKIMPAEEFTVLIAKREQLLKDREEFMQENRLCLGEELQKNILQMMEEKIVKLNEKIEMHTNAERQSAFRSNSAGRGTNNDVRVRSSMTNQGSHANRDIYEERESIDGYVKIM